MLYQLAVLTHHGFVLSYMKISSQATTDKPIDLEFSASFNYHPVRLIVSAMFISHDTVFFSHNKTASAGS